MKTPISQLSGSIKEMEIKPRDSAGGIVIARDGTVALVNQGSNIWSFPKGGIETGEDVLTAAKREVAEECGLTDLTLLGELDTYKRRRIAKGGVGEDMDHPESTRTLFIFGTESQRLDSQDVAEIVDAKFVTLDEASHLLTHPKDKAFLEAMRPRIEEAIHQWMH